MYDVIFVLLALSFLSIEKELWRGRNGQVKLKEQLRKMEAEEEEEKVPILQ